MLNKMCVILAQATLFSENRNCIDSKSIGTMYDRFTTHNI